MFISCRRWTSLRFISCFAALSVTIGTGIGPVPHHGTSKNQLWAVGSEMGSNCISLPKQGCDPSKSKGLMELGDLQLDQVADGVDALARERGDPPWELSWNRVEEEGKGP